jgi:hypothetical protein
MAPRNYDELRDAEERSFVIRGETFQIRRGRPEMLGELTEAEDRFVKLEAKGYPDILAFSEERLKLLLDPADDALARWDALRAREEDPVTYGEIIDISRWAVEAITRLPTRLAVPSDVGPGPIAASSTAG